MLEQQKQSAPRPPIEVVGSTPLKRKSSTIRAVVTRADGTVEDRGIISFSHSNLIINAIGAPLARFNGWLQERIARFKRRNLP